MQSFLKSMLLLITIATYAVAFFYSSPQLHVLKIGLTTCVALFGLPMIFLVWRAFFLALRGRDDEIGQTGLPAFLVQVLIVEAKGWRKAWFFIQDKAVQRFRQWL